MPTFHREVEYRFEVSEDAAIPALDSISDVVGLQGQGTHELIATHFDTEDRVLARAGIRLRRRTGGDDPGWHLKLPVDSTSRNEIKLPLGRAMHTVPKALREALELHTRGADLEPDVELRTQRHTQRYQDADGTVLFQVSDNFFAETPLRPKGATKTAWTTVTRGWEAELVDGERHQLREAAELLRAAGGRPTDLPGPDTGKDSFNSAGDVVLARLRAQVAVIKYIDPLVRLDSDGAVHQMRVAMRRLRSALATFRPLFDKEQTEPIREELKWIAGVLGKARDAEVMAHQLRELVDQQPPELVIGPVRSRIDSDMGAIYRSGHEESIDAMSSDRYVALVQRLDALVLDPPWTELAENDPDALRARVQREFKRMRKLVTQAKAAEGTESRNELLHEVRKAAKRTRYAAETVQPVFGRRAKRFGRGAKKVQSVLGDQHDAAVALGVLRDLGASAHQAGENAFTFGRLHAAEEAAATDLAAQFEQVWAHASAKRLRRWLG